VRNAFVILRMVATARYLHLKSQELPEALMEAHGILGEDADERVRLREEGPAQEANARRVIDLADQLSALTNQHQEAQAAAAFQAERARLAEWDAGHLRGQIGLIQQDLARARDDLIAAVAQAHTQVTGLEDRLKVSVAAEREASARSNQQATSLAELSARLQQQHDSSRADRDSAFPVPAFVIVGCTGGQRIIIVHDPSGTHVSGHGQYQPHVRRVWQQGGCRYSSREPRAAWKDLHAF
jgi:hypothetical protein